MTKDDFLKIGVAAGYEPVFVQNGPTELCCVDMVRLERFAQLVAAHEREQCAKVCDELAELNRLSLSDSMWQQGECAAVIRARGQS
jgi:hypothetical protein